MLLSLFSFFFFFFFNDTATTEIYTLSLHDALPISDRWRRCGGHEPRAPARRWRDRKSTRLNSSHANISYAVFCLKKKKNRITTRNHQKKKKENKLNQEHHEHK